MKTKRRTNLLKHGVDFADAVGIFYDNHAITIIDTYHHHEQRLITMGMDFNLNLLVVVNTQRQEDTIRIISACKADRKECKQYEGH